MERLLGKSNKKAANTFTVCTTICMNDCHARGLVCPSTAHLAGMAAKERAASLVKRKVSINANDLFHIRRLGKGGFCEVDEMQYLNEVFAVKRLRQTIVLDPAECVEGVADLAGEAAIMTKLNHENILKVRGMASGSITQNLIHGDGFFVVLERLERTLAQQIEEVWKDQKPKGLASRQKKRGALFGRLSSALQIAKALRYLHQRNIVHRDLKPDNIGYDLDGTVKLFDFGFAIERNSDEPLTEYCGSTRYMSPEVAMGHSYGQEVDVYAFGLILWQISEVGKPFKGLTQEEHIEKVFQKRERPQLRKWWPSKLKGLIKQGWDASPSKRPTMDQVVETLQEILSK